MRLSNQDKKLNCNCEKQSISYRNCLVISIASDFHFRPVSKWRSPKVYSTEKHFLNAQASTHLGIPPNEFIAMQKIDVQQNSCTFGDHSLIIFVQAALYRYIFIKLSSNLHSRRIKSKSFLYEHCQIVELGKILPERIKNRIQKFIWVIAFDKRNEPIEETFKYVACQQTGEAAMFSSTFQQLALDSWFLYP